MLDIDLGLLGLTAAVFLVLIVLLNNMLYKPLVQFMDEREASIKRDLENAVSNEDESQKMLDEAKTILANAKAEAAKMKQEALEAIKAESAQKIEAKKSELESKQEAFMADLAKEEEQVKAALISQLPLFKEALKAKFNQL